MPLLIPLLPLAISTVLLLLNVYRFNAMKLPKATKTIHDGIHGVMWHRAWWTFLLYGSFNLGWWEEVGRVLRVLK